MNGKNHLQNRTAKITVHSIDRGVLGNIYFIRSNIQALVAFDISFTRPARENFETRSLSYFKYISTPKKASKKDEI